MPLYLGANPVGLGGAARAFLGSTLLYDPSGSGVSVTVENSTTGTGDLQWEYAGTWQTSSTEHYSSTAGATATLRFTGTSFALYGTKDAHHGIMSVSIDGGAAVNVDCYNASRAAESLLFDAGTLTDTAHTVVCNVTGTKSASSSGTVVAIDRAVVQSTSGAEPTPVASNVLWSGDDTQSTPAAAYDFNYVQTGTNYEGRGSMVGGWFRSVIGPEASYGYRAHNEGPTATEPRNSVRLRYRFRVNQKGGMDTTDCKVGFGLVGAPAGATNQNGFSTGGTKNPDAWSARTSLIPANYLGGTHPWCMAYYLYAWRAGGQSYVDFGLRKAYRRLSDNAYFTPVVGQEYEHVIEYANNTPGVADGIYRCWIDGEQYVDLTDVQWNEATNQPFRYLLCGSFSNAAISSAAHFDQRLVSLESSVRRDATNTGIAGKGLTTASLTTFTGSNTLTTDGAVYERMYFPDRVYIKADNITFRECLIESPGALYSIHWTAKADGTTPKGALFEDCTIDGKAVAGVNDGTANGGGPSALNEPNLGFTMRRCNLSGAADILKPQGGSATRPILVEDSYLHTPVKWYFLKADGVTLDSTHSDVLQIAGGGSHTTVRRCTLDGYRANEGGEVRYASSSGCQFGSFSAGSTLSDTVIEDCYIDGGGYAFTLDKLSTLNSITNCQIRNNRFGLRHLYSGVFNAEGTLAADGSTIAISGNVWDATGVTDGGLSVTAGQSANT